jgi:nucleoside-diphosphate-sugar epimerase
MNGSHILMEQILGNNNMKVAITGSAGFIGSNLVDACLDKCWHVVGIDNFATGCKEMADPIRFVNKPGKYTLANFDINETKDLAKAFAGCETVFHLAALPRVSYSIDYPLEANEANITGVLSVLEAARTSGVKRVVFSCSSSIYGGVAEFPTTELAPASPKSPYALHKQAGAEYCRLYSELHGLQTVSLLYFNVFGKFQRSNSAYATVIPAFFDAAMNGKSCRIDGDGEQSRDFCHVENVVQANILAAEYEKQLMGDRFNIATGNTYTVNDVYDQVKSLLKIKLKKHNVPPRLGDPRKSHADISKAKTILGYKPIIEFEDGMRLTAGWWLSGCQTK